ncbi:MAG: methylenetetrahydrofolate reductase [Armatimonadota bacterium]
MGMREALQSGRFIVTAEVAPPKGIHFEHVLEEADMVRGRVTGINVTDLQSAVTRASSLGLCIRLLEAGHHPILQMVCRDRNRLSLQSELLTAAAFGVTDVLALTGDYVTLGDDKSAMPVFDLDSVQLIEAAKTLEAGHDLAGNELEGAPPSFCMGCVVNPGVEPLGPQIMKLRKKIDAGAEFIQTQAVYDPARFEYFMEQAGDLGVPVLAGIVVLKSAGMAKFMNKNVAGVTVPSALIERMQNTQDKKQETTQITIELIDALRPMCQGVHIMPLGWMHVVPPVLDALGL